MKKVLVYFHTHWDREWYKTRIDFNFRLVKVFDEVINKLLSGDLPYFYFDGQTSALMDYLKFRPEKEDVIKKLINENKLAIGPFFCSTDSFLVSAQSMLSNIDIGLKYSNQFGCNNFIGYCADTFGHSKSLPTIFKYYNFEAGIFWRGLGNLPCCFNWNGYKSVYLRQGYFHDYLNTNLDYQKKAELIETQLNKIDDGSNILLLPLGADHLKVADNIQKQISEINKYLKNYKLIISSPFEYIKNVKPTADKNGELYDNSRNFVLSGVFSSRIDIKQLNSSAQWNLLRLAEPLNALCYANKLTKENYQPQIDIAKEELLKNHAHDSIYGCSIDEVHKDMLHRFTTAEQTASAVIENILNELEEETNNISIINLSDYIYSGMCEITTAKHLKNAQLIKKDFYVDRDLSLDTNRIPVTEDFKPIYTYLFEVNNIKPLSIEKIELKKPQSDIKITNTSIENSNIKLKIKNNKIEVTDKKNHQTYNNFIEILDSADVGDSYNYAPLKKDKEIKAEIIKSRIKTAGDLRATLEVDFKIYIPLSSTIKGRSKTTVPCLMKMFVSIDKNSDFINFNIKWKNKSLNHILKVVFKFTQVVNKIISDDMLGTIERTFDINYKLSDHIPAARGIELKSNTGCMQTFFATQGIAVITKGLNEYTTYKNTVALTILRATNTISNPKNPARGTPAGPPIETADLQQLKENHAEFALTFNTDIKKIKMIQQVFYKSAFAFFGNKNITLLKAKNELITATYNNDLKIRFYDNKNGRLCDH